MTPPTPLSYRQLFLSVMNRDLKVAVHNKGDILNPLIFLVIVITLFPLGIGPETKLLTRIAPGIIWWPRYYQPYCPLNDYLKTILSTVVWNKCY